MIELRWKVMTSNKEGFLIPEPVLQYRQGETIMTNPPYGIVPPTEWKDVPTEYVLEKESE